jgi:hypothetical protein
MNQATVTQSISSSEDKGFFDRRTLWKGLLLLIAVAGVLFLLSSRVVNVFDEGIFLTATMRTMSGQVLHRDFYYNYGPVQPYLLACLFKLFGVSVLVERLADIFSASLLVVTLYALARRFCHRVVAAVVAVVCLLWVIGLTMSQSLMNPALCTLIVWISFLIVPVASKRLQRQRALIAGFLAAIVFLFRYDMAVGLAAANFAAVLAMNWMQEPSARRSLGWLVKTVIAPYLAAFAITAAPAAIAYLLVAPLHDLLYDVVFYMAKYYRAGRGLPFPVPRFGPTFYELAIYLLPILIALGLWVGARFVIARRKAPEDTLAGRTPDWLNLVVALSIAAAMTCMRGMVRAGVGGMYASVMACALTGGIMFQHRRELNRWLQGLLMATLVLFGLTAATSAEMQLLSPFTSIHQIHLRPLAINWILTPDRQPPAPGFRGWCHDDTPITKGFCFLLDEDRIMTVRYLDAHTRPGDYLFEGLPHHDRIIQNDNILYFAVQRLPAVRWSQFDPFLENRADIQQEMIGSLEQHKPPYLVLDSEFENAREPNGSSISTGVHLIDHYIATHYTPVEQYGKLTIMRRRQ